MPWIVSFLQNFRPRREENRENVLAMNYFERFYETNKQEDIRK